MLGFLTLVGVGHLTGAFLFYAIHRWIFHGRLSNPWVKTIFSIPLLGYLARKGRKIHVEHHRESFVHGEDIHNHMNVFFPLWGKVAVAGIVSVFALASLPFAVGVCSFFPVYAYRHHAAHSGSNSAYAKHHLHHHFKNTKVNHGGIYPIFDKIFGTFEPQSD